MNIKIVKNTVSKYPECPASYNSKTKTILIKKYTRKKKRSKLIIHEFGHYLIDIICIFPMIKHYINLLWEYLWIIFFSPLSDKKEDFQWYYEYYNKNAKKRDWVY